jgi:hypothetical protein
VCIGGNYRIFLGIQTYVALNNVKLTLRIQLNNSRHVKKQENLTHNEGKSTKRTQLMELVTKAIGSTWEA